MRALDRLHQLTDHGCPGGVGELRELLEMLIRGSARSGPLTWRADKNCPFDGCLDSDELFADGYLPRVL
jgi:hypothetical protein